MDELDKSNDTEKEENKHESGMMNELQFIGILLLFTLFLMLLIVWYKSDSHNTPQNNVSVSLFD